MAKTYAVMNLRNSGAELRLPIELNGAIEDDVEKDLENLAHKLGVTFLYVDEVEEDGN